jgi:hypothetical protein
LADRLALGLIEALVYRRDGVLWYATTLFLADAALLLIVQRETMQPSRYAAQHDFFSAAVKHSGFSD